MLDLWQCSILPGMQQLLHTAALWLCFGRVSLHLLPVHL